MKGDDIRRDLVAAIAELQEERSLDLVRRRVEAGEDPLLIMQDCKEGMRQVGAHYERNEYFLAGLIMADEIFRQVMEILQPAVRARVSGKASGQILLGTVEGDIHDLGKNIVNMLLSCHSIDVHDLGVDVAPAVFVERATQIRPDIVGLSGLLTISYDSMRETVALLRAHGLTMPIIIGGGQLTEDVCRFVQADHWTTDAVVGVDLCRKLIPRSGEASAS
jgi:methanogenic corrinoid protein MtbC1